LTARFTIHAGGGWPEGAVTTAWVLTGRRIVPEVERRIDEAWSAASERLGPRKLFDGPMCRLEAWEASPRQLRLSLSPTSYKPFFGTNLSDATLADRYGADVLANPVGLSTALQSADGWLLLGRRNDSVAYYPNRVHPFAGALEPAAVDGADLNVFDEIRRELREELGLSKEDIASIRCIGMVEDLSLRQPELVFHAVSTRTRSQIEATLERDEHHASYAIRATRAAAEAAMDDGMLTPVAVGSLSLWLRLH
jgi:hypothetical protein